MSRTIHKTVAQVVRDNSRQEINDPDNLDVADLAKKGGYKTSARKKRREAAQAGVVAGIVPDDKAGSNNSFKPKPLRGSA